MTADERSALKEAQRKAKRNSRIFLAIKIGFFAVFVAVLIFLIVRKGNEDGKIQTDFIQTGVIDESFRSELTFIRTEYEVASPAGGKFIPKVNEGDKVAAGTVIAHVVKEGYEEQLKKLREIESKIAVANNASSYIGSETNVELDEINRQIKILREKITTLAFSGDISLYAQYKSDLETALEIKNNILLNIDAPNAYVQELNKEYNAIYQTLSNYMKEVVAEQAGVISFYLDDNQNQSSLNAMKITEYVNADPESMPQLSDTVIDFSPNEMEYMYEKTVVHGQPVARITPDVSYYISVDCTEVQLAGINVDSNIMLKSVNRDYSVTAQVVKIFKNGKDSAILLKTSHGLRASLSDRTVEGDVILSYTEGIKVVKRCLAEIDSAGITARIAIVRYGFVEYVYVNILASDDEYVIISNIRDLAQEDEETSVRINDLYVINHEDVKEGQVIK